MIANFKFNEGDIVKPLDSTIETLKALHDDDYFFNLEKEEIARMLEDPILEVDYVIPAGRFLNEDKNLYGFVGYDVFCLYEYELEEA